MFRLVTYIYILFFFSAFVLLLFSCLIQINFHFKFTSHWQTQEINRHLAYLISVTDKHRAQYRWTPQIRWKLLENTMHEITISILFFLSVSWYIFCFFSLSTLCWRWFEQIDSFIYFHVNRAYHRWSKINSFILFSCTWKQDAVIFVHKIWCNIALRERNCFFFFFPLLVYQIQQ